MAMSICADDNACSSQRFEALPKRYAMQLSQANHHHPYNQCFLSLKLVLPKVGLLRPTHWLTLSSLVIGEMSSNRLNDWCSKLVISQSVGLGRPALEDDGFMFWTKGRPISRPRAPRGRPLSSGSEVSCRIFDQQCWSSRR